jgi:hypothetical protein
MHLEDGMTESGLWNQAPSGPGDLLGYELDEAVHGGSLTNTPYFKYA